MADRKFCDLWLWDGGPALAELIAEGKGAVRLRWDDGKQKCYSWGDVLAMLANNEAVVIWRNTAPPGCESQNTLEALERKLAECLESEGPPRWCGQNNRMR